MESARTAPTRHPNTHHPQTIPQYHPSQSYASPYPPPQAAVQSTLQAPLAALPQGPPHPGDHRAQPHYPPAPIAATAPPSSAHASQTTVAHQYSQPQPAATYYSHGPPLPPIQQQQHHAHQSPTGSQQTHPGQETVVGPPVYRQAVEAGAVAREGEYQTQYSQHSQSGHATPATVTQRSYSHEVPQRPPSTSVGSAPETKAVMEHAMHQGYPPPNGVHHAGMPVYGPPPQHEHQVAYASTPVVDHHQGYAPPPAHPHMYQGYQASVSQYGAGAPQAGKRRPQRAQQACEQCRQRKQKCDEGTPCTFCRDQNMECTYRDTPPAKTDKNQEKIMSILEELLASSKKQDDRADAMDRRVAKLEHQDEDEKKLVGSGIIGSKKPEGKRLRARDHRTGPHKLITLWPSIPLLFKPGEPPDDGYVAAAEDRGVLRIYGRGEGIDDHDGTQPGAGSSPASDDGSDNLPTPREGLWGRGFINHSNASSVRPASTVAGFNADGSLDLDSSTIWSLHESFLTHMHCMHPFLDKSRTRRLIENFVSHYSPDSPGRRHPTFATAAAIGSMEHDRPQKRLRTTENPLHNGANVSLESPRNSLVTDRSPANGLVWLILALGKVCQHTAPLPGIVTDGRTTTNQATLHQLTGNSGLQSSSPSNYAVKTLPTSPRSTPLTNGTPPEPSVHRGEHNRSRRSSHDSGSTVPLRNLDVIPGLAYYAKAAEILGDQGDGADLAHAQMFLLAALYKGQLARVKESMGWLFKAGRVCQMLVDRYNLYKPELFDHVEDWRELPADVQQTMWEEIAKKTSEKRNNLILLASWSALQLESDILAEMKFPHSHINDIEDILIHPPGMPPDEDAYEKYTINDNGYDNSSLMMSYYQAQLFLRRRLNDLHRQLYGTHVGDDDKEVITLIQNYESELATWRQGIPAALQWNDDEPPATNILAARLRAKYYGALYVSTRPYLDYALHIMPQVKEGQAILDAAIDAKNRPRNAVEVQVFKALSSMGDSAIWRGTQVCIAAALKSTVALDRVGQTADGAGGYHEMPRLIVTNIHGTAHAQFGNMLVLAAAHHAKHTHHLVPTQDFKEKLQRTIGFLRKLACLSPTLAHDALYLERIQQKLFPIPDDAKAAFARETEPPSATNSFSMDSC